MRRPHIDLRDLGARLSWLRAIPLHLSGRQRRIARWAGMGLLAIVSFLVTLKFVFPYERVKGKLIDALGEKYDVRVGDVGPGFLPGTIVFEDVVLRSRPEGPDEKPGEVVVDRLVVDLGLDFGLLGALRKKMAFDVDAELNGGEVEADIDMSASMFEAHVETQALALDKLPGVAAAVGLPMTGSLEADIDLRLPGGKWKNAEGRIRLDCDNCTVGDGVTKMTMSPNTSSSSSRRRPSNSAAAAWAATGVEVPRLALGETEVTVDISKGVGEIKNFSATSQDGWLKIEGKIEFRDPFANSLFPGCMRFKLSDELKKRAPRFGNIEYTLSEKMRQADGSYAIPTKGKLTEMRWDVRRKCGGGSIEDTVVERPSERPGLGRRPFGQEVPPQGGLPILPGQVPGVAGAVPPPEGVATDPSGQPGGAVEVPQPGASGPPMADPTVPGQPTVAGQPTDQAPAPAPEQDPGGAAEQDFRGLRRIPPDETVPPQAPPAPEGAEPAPPPAPVPAPAPDEDAGYPRAPGQTQAAPGNTGDAGYRP